MNFYLPTTEDLKYKIKSLEEFIVKQNTRYAASREEIRVLKERNAILVEALKFFAEPYTWSRVWADADSSEIGSGALNNMYGSMAREELKKAGVE